MRSVGWFSGKLRLCCPETSGPSFPLVLVGDRHRHGQFVGHSAGIGCHHHDVVDVVRAGVGGVFVVGRAGEGQGAGRAESEGAGVGADERPGDVALLRVGGPVRVQGGGVVLAVVELGPAAGADLRRLVDDGRLEGRLKHRVLRRGAEFPRVVAPGGRIAGVQVVVHVHVPLGVYVLCVRVRVRVVGGRLQLLSGLAGTAGAGRHPRGIGIPIAVFDGASVVLPHQAVLPHQPADICRACDGTSGVAGADRARGVVGGVYVTVVDPHQPTGRTIRGHDRGRGIARADCGVIQPHQTADYSRARHWTRGEAGADGADGVGVGAVSVRPHQTADIVRTYDGAGGVGVADCATLVRSHQPAGVFPGIFPGKLRAGDRAGGKAGEDGALTVVQPDQPADLRAPERRLRPGHVAPSHGWC